MKSLTFDNLSHISQYLGIKEALKIFSSVCKEWRRVIDSDMFWESACQQKSINNSSSSSINRYVRQQSLDLRQIYSLPNFKLIYPIYLTEFIRSDVSNFRCNPHKMVQIENVPIGSDNPRSIKFCFATSYRFCAISQNISLSDYVKHSLRMVPDGVLLLKLSFWFSSRFDQGSQFKYELSIDGKVFSLPTYHNPVGNTWRIYTKHYPVQSSTLSKISFKWEGKDETLWAGFYGAKLANVSITLVANSPEVTNEAVIEEVDL